MTTPETEAAITAATEAAARALVAHQGDDWDNPEIWQRTPSLIADYHDDYRRAARAAITATLPELHAAWVAGRAAIKREPCGETLHPDMPHRLCVEPRGHELHHDGNAVVWQIDGPRVRAQVLAEVEAALRDGIAFGMWLRRSRGALSAPPENLLVRAADYIRDTLTPKENHG